MELMSTYIVTSDFDKSIEFYKKILQIEPIVYCENRWVEFEVGNKISLYNKKFDEERINNSSNYNQAYIDDFNKEKGERKNNIVTFNFYTDDLNSEYERIKALNISVSDVMYVNIVEPYYYFNVTDPDGNVLEICSDKCENMY